MTCRPLGAALLLAAFAVVTTSPVASGQGKKNKGGNSAPSIDSAKLGPGEYVGILRSSPGTDRTFTIQMTQTRVVPVVRSLRSVQLRPNTTKHEIDFQASPKVKVRTLVLPEQFDERGRPKKYTAKELAEFKGKDRGLVGYESSLDKLEAGMEVRVTLRAAPAKTEKAKDKDGEDGGQEKKMQASVIVVTKGAGDGPAVPGKKKKE